jgi:hypothetical protein
VVRIGGCFVCFEPVQGAGAAGDQGFAGAAVTYRRRLLAVPQRPLRKIPPPVATSASSGDNKM